MVRRNVILSVIQTVISLFIFGWAPVHAGLTQGINRIIAREKGVEYTIHVLNGETGATLYDHSAKRALSPASNMKIVTSSVALQYLGKDYEFVTRIGMMGDTLVVIGGGDPLLGDPEADPCAPYSLPSVLSEITQRLERLGVKKISDIVVDTTFFDDQRVHPHWLPNDLNKAFAAEVCALNFFANKIDLRIDNIDGRVEIAFEPQTTFLTVTNKVAPSTRGDSAVAALRRPGYPNQIELRGKVHRAQGIELAIERPAAYFGFFLAEELIKKGISVEGQLQERVVPSEELFVPVVEFRTPLKQVLQRCNKDSFNLAAESLLKTIAAYATKGGRLGGWAVGQRVIGSYLEALGIPEEEFVIDDGSGLSSYNRLSARALTQLLYAMYQSEYWDFYFATLASGGIDGTIQKYDEFKKPPYLGNIRGKTGYISGVKSFSGVCTVGNQLYFFAILANKAKGHTRTAINDIARTIIDNG